VFLLDFIQFHQSKNMKVVDVGFTLTCSNSYGIDRESNSLADIQKREKRDLCRWSE
jgi:hypothetical protein